VKKRKEKPLLRRSRSFKVIEVGTNRKPVCDFLSVINGNWHPISYRFGVIAAYCSNFPPTRSLWLKISGTRGRLPPIIFARIVRPMNQLCSWQFSRRCYGWDATSENRAKIVDFAPTRSLWSKISGTRDRPPLIIFARLVRPMYALQLCRWQFLHKETLSRLSSSEVRFLLKSAVLRFSDPLWGT